MRDLHSVGWPGSDDEPVIDLDLPESLDEEALEAMATDTRRFVFNTLFVAVTVLVLIAWFSVR